MCRPATPHSQQREPVLAISRFLVVAEILAELRTAAIRKPGAGGLGLRTGEGGESDPEMGICGVGTDSSWEVVHMSPSNSVLKGCRRCRSRRVLSSERRAYPVEG